MRLRVNRFLAIGFWLGMAGLAAWIVFSVVCIDGKTTEVLRAVSADNQLVATHTRLDAGGATVGFFDDVNVGSVGGKMQECVSLVRLDGGVELAWLGDSSLVVTFRSGVIDEWKELVDVRGRAVRIVVKRTEPIEMSELVGRNVELNRKAGPIE